MKQNTRHPKFLPPTILFIALLLMLVSHFLFPIFQVVLGFWRFLGFLPLLSGLILSFGAERQFHQLGTTVHPFKDSSILVSDGFFRFSRNPMYLGMALILLGAALLFGSLTPLGIFAFFIGWIDTQFIRLEEEKLSAQFGQDWLEYKAQVRRWI
jgi:protein-S-isoprenylcysteine O-methyltransferase Ste14